MTNEDKKAWNALHLREICARHGLGESRKASYFFSQFTPDAPISDSVIRHWFGGGRPGSRVHEDALRRGLSALGEELYGSELPEPPLAEEELAAASGLVAAMEQQTAVLERIADTLDRWLRPETAE
jgi:hypothetical protein